MERDIPDLVWLPDPPQDRRGGAVTEFTPSASRSATAAISSPPSSTAPSPPHSPSSRPASAPPASRRFSPTSTAAYSVPPRWSVRCSRAATGRDINIVSSRTRTDEPPPAPGDTQAKQPADQPATHKASRRTSLRKGWNELLEFMHYIAGSIATVMREKSHREQAFVSEQYELAGARMLAFSNNAQLALRRGYSPSYERLYHEP